MPIEHRPLLGVSEAAALTGLGTRRSSARPYAKASSSPATPIRRPNASAGVTSTTGSHPCPNGPNRRARRIRHGPRMAPSSRAGVVSFPDVSTP